ncbi:MAG: AMP-binding protein, partial [Tannerella sp.]|nr:AMP-binding protein [Tannerella sp.]
MLERFLTKTSFDSQADFIANFQVNVPENFNYGYDVVDAWAAEAPGKRALCWTSDRGEHVDFTFADMKAASDRTASWFQSLGIGRGDMVMLILKRRYEFWYAIIALHKLGAIAIPATHLLTKKDIVYRANAAGIKAIVCVGEEPILKHVAESLPESPSVERLISIGPLVPDGFDDFRKGIREAAPFVRPAQVNTNGDTSLMYFTSGTSGNPKMVIHDFTYPLGHIVTACFWHNLQHDSLH